MPLCHMQRTETLHTAVPPEPLHLLSVCHSRCCCWTATTARIMGAAQSQPRQGSSTSTGMNAMEAADEQREWVALHTGVLQHIFSLASTWQTPGPCLASLVCRTWRSAAAGCRGIRLLFHAGHAPADQGFVTWLALTSNAQRLAALTLSCSSGAGSTARLLEALAGAAAAAAAAGQPLPLHTLRVLRGDVTTQTAGRLVAGLPNLRCLQLAVTAGGRFRPAQVECEHSLGSLAPLQQATQLQELYWEGPATGRRSDGDLVQLLPTSLRRLSWDFWHMCSSAGTRSYLTQLTFLQLRKEPFHGLGSHHLPAGLQQLELWGEEFDLDVVEQHREVLTCWEVGDLQERGSKELLARLPHLRALGVDAEGFSTAGAAVKHLTQLKALELTDCFSDDIEQALATAASISSVRRLHLSLWVGPKAAGLSALTQLTQLRLAYHGGHDSAQQQQALGEAVGMLAGLQWLSVPAVLLVPGQAWLGGLQQLRVLVLQCSTSTDVAYVSSMSWVQGLPSRLQVLGVSQVSAKEAAALQLRTRLQRALASRGCEVVVGVDLDEAADPTQQLAGLPVALQQALAPGVSCGQLRSAHML